jgi:hypothetical protein
MNYKITFPASWIDPSVLEQVLQHGCEPHGKNIFEITFIFPIGCKIMVGTAVRLLSLFNQLDCSARRVRLQFDEGQTGTMGYLNRMGFFDHLSSRIDVYPSRPIISGARTHMGRNADLVEIANVSPSSRDRTLLSRLTGALMHSCSGREDANTLEEAAWTIFAELIDNIFSHSNTQLDGYAALQLYPNGKSLQVAVSDSGKGIMNTLRPSLKKDLPQLNMLSDTDLLVEVFRQGISRYGAERGCGLKGSAAKAIKYNADLDVRLPNTRVLLTPGNEGYRPNTAYRYESLPLIWGTHICFTFHLDRQSSSR